MKVKFISLASGSSGNCYYIGTEKYGILIDAGISPVINLLLSLSAMEKIVWRMTSFKVNCDITIGSLRSMYGI